MVLGVSCLRVLAQRPTGCCSASIILSCNMRTLSSLNWIEVWHVNAKSVRCKPFLKQTENGRSSNRNLKHDAMFGLTWQPDCVHSSHLSRFARSLPMTDVSALSFNLPGFYIMFCSYPIWQRATIIICLTVKTRLQSNLPKGLLIILMSDADANPDSMQTLH